MLPAPLQSARPARRDPWRSAPLLTRIVAGSLPGKFRHASGMILEVSMIAANQSLGSSRECSLQNQCRLVRCWREVRARFYEILACAQRLSRHETVPCRPSPPYTWLWLGYHPLITPRRRFPARSGVAAKQTGARPACRLWCAGRFIWRVCRLDLNWGHNVRGMRRRLEFRVKGIKTGMAVGL